MRLTEKQIIITIKKDDFGQDESYNLFLWCEKHKIKVDDPRNSKGLYDRLIIHLDTLEKQILFQNKYLDRLKKVASELLALQGEPTKELCPICGRELTRTCFYCTKELCSPFNLQEKGEPTKDIINDDVIEKYVLKNYPVQIIGTGINKIDVNSYFRECLIKELKAMRDGTIAEWAKKEK